MLSNLQSAVTHSSFSLLRQWRAQLYFKVCQNASAPITNKEVPYHMGLFSVTFLHPSHTWYPIAFELVPSF